VLAVAKIALGIIKVVSLALALSGIAAPLAPILYMGTVVSGISSLNLKLFILNNEKVQVPTLADMNFTSILDTP
jgi:hypothetical protein